jgi:hypothetical protein
MFPSAGHIGAPARRAEAHADLPEASADVDKVSVGGFEVFAGVVEASPENPEATAGTVQAAAAHRPPSPQQLEANAALTRANAGGSSLDAAAFEAFEVVEKSPHSAEDSRARRRRWADKGNLMPARDGGTTKRGRPANNTPKTESQPGSAAAKPEQSDAVVGFEAKLWLMADKLRNNMDAAEYKHVVLGLIFLKYISDAFEEKHAALEADKKSGADPEDPDEYRAETIFWVPKEARWSFLQASAKQPSIGKLLDDAMVSIERDNATLNGVLPKDYGRPALDKTRLGELIDLVGTIGLGDKNNRSRDVLGRVYPPDKQEAATNTVLQQAELLSDFWVETRP